MTNEQTIEEICSDLARYSETVHSGAYRAMRRAEHALLSSGRQLAAKDARIALAEGCLTRAGWEYIPDAIHGPVWKPPVNKAAADLRAAKAELAAKDAEITELKRRLADSMRDLQALKASPTPEQEPSAWRIPVHMGGPDNVTYTVVRPTGWIAKFAEPLYAATRDGAELA